MQSIASVAFTDLRTRQFEQTLWGPMQHPRPPGNALHEEERTKEPNHLFSFPLPLVGQPNLRELLCVRQYVQTISGEIHTIPDPSRYFTRCGAVLPCLRFSPSSFPLPNALQRTPARLRTESLPWRSGGTQERFIATGPVAGRIKNNLWLITLAASPVGSVLF